MTLYFLILFLFIILPLSITIIILYFDEHLKSSNNFNDNFVNEINKHTTIIIEGIKKYHDDINYLRLPENYEKRIQILKEIEATKDYEKNEWLVALRLDILAIDNKET